MAGADLQIRIPNVHEPVVEPPIPCAEICITCHGKRLPCTDRPTFCTPGCMRMTRTKGPVHVCLVTTVIPARLVVRPSDSSAAYVTPWGDIVQPRPSLFPWLVVDTCPKCGRTHAHTITRPEHRWYRVAPCGQTYILTLAPGAIA